MVEFNQEVIKRIEAAMGFKLYKWQQNYLMNEFNLNHNYRMVGNTTIYAIKKLLTLEKVININSNFISDLCDYDPTGRMSHGWFKKELKSINDKLLSVGFATCLETEQDSQIKSESNLLEIKLKDTDSVPEVYYKGEQLFDKRLHSIKYEWQTCSSMDDVGKQLIEVVGYDIQGNHSNEFPSLDAIKHDRANRDT